MSRCLYFLVFILISSCGVDSTADMEVGLSEQETDVVSQELTARNLSILALEIDVAMGQLTNGTTRLLTDATTARSLLGPVLPTGLSFSRHWLLAYRPTGKKPSSRMEITRVQLSASGKTLTVWATEHEALPGCQPWRPNELAVVRIPKQAKRPERISVQIQFSHFSCGLVTGTVCNAALPCPSSTPYCLGQQERPDGSFTDGQCVSFSPYGKSSFDCQQDGACQPGGFCSNLSHSPGGGLCQPDWMRGTYSTQPFSLAIPKGNGWLSVPILVSRQASVPMDLGAQLFVNASSSDFRHLRFRLINPAGTVSMEAPILTMGQRSPVLTIPRDEHVNGEWKLEVTDTRSIGTATTLLGARLSVTSRWD